MAWQQFVMKLDTLCPDAVEEIFNRCGASSVSLSDAGDDAVLEPGPGETPLWTQTRITGLFPGDADINRLRSALLARFGLTNLPPYRVEAIADRDWEREWLNDFRPMSFGSRLWISPADMPVEQQDAIVVRLDPGLAFGTGTHATTALCLEWLDELALADSTLLDYGCGSGVLAIAALKLGCRCATAIDIDPQALLATRQNASRNNVLEHLVVGHGDADIDGTFDIVVANILAGPLVECAESMVSRLARRGMLTLSGILREQVTAVLAAYAPWIEFREPVFREQDGQVWSRLTGTRR